MCSPTGSAAPGTSRSRHNPCQQRPARIGLFWPGCWSARSVVVVDEERRSLERDIDAAIQAYVRREYGLSIGERTAEEINRHIGSAASPPYEGRVEVKGREVMSGLPKTVVLTSVEIRRAIEEP